MNGEIKAKTPYGEISIDQLAEIQPGLGKLMKDVSERFASTYYAAKGGNWKVAAYELNQVRASFKVGKVTRPKFAEDLDAFDSAYLVPIFKAIQKQDWAEFEAAYWKGVDGTDFYHDKRGYPHIRIVLPRDSPSYVYLGPMEKFKREKTQ